MINKFLISEVKTQSHLQPFAPSKVLYGSTHLMTCLLEKKLKITFTKFINVLQGAPFSLVIRHGDFRHRQEN